MNSSGNTTRHRILTALLIVLFSASCASQKPPIFDPDVDVFTLFSGEWGNSNEHSCSKNAHRISFTDGGKKAVFAYQHPPLASSDVSYLPIESQSPEVSTDDTIVFNVLDHGDTWLILRRENETRRGTNGKRGRFTYPVTSVNTGGGCMALSLGKNHWSLEFDANRLSSMKMRWPNRERIRC